MLILPEPMSRICCRNLHGGVRTGLGSKGSPRTHAIGAHKRLILGVSTRKSS
jgi:hypothetical protein